MSEDLEVPSNTACFFVRCAPTALKIHKLFSLLKYIKTGVNAGFMNDQFTATQICPLFFYKPRVTNLSQTTSTFSL